MSKECRVCGHKLIAGVNWSDRRAIGNQYICKECDNQYHREYAKQHEEQHRIYQRKNRLKTIYKGTPEQYDNILKAQNNKCAICGKKFSKNNPPFIDHDHKTGKIRGLLCNICNLHLGIHEKYKDKFKQYLLTYNNSKEDNSL